MAGMLRKGMTWLGLGPDDEYDDYYEDREPDIDLRRAAADPVSPVRAVGAEDTEWDEAESASVRVLPTAAARAARVYPSEPSSHRTTVVRPLPTSGPTSIKPHVVVPESFNDAQQVGDWFRKRQPVILNLQGLDRDLARRLLDFSSGVAYGLAGRVEKVASQVYLLSPPDVEVPADERDRLRDRGFHD